MIFDTLADSIVVNVFMHPYRGLWSGYMSGETLIFQVYLASLSCRPGVRLDHCANSSTTLTMYCALQDSQHQRTTLEQ